MAKSSENASTKPLQAASVGIDTRARILAAALRLFRKRGYHDTGLNDILEHAQAPKGSLYHHFPKGKEEIGVAVVGQIAVGIIGLLDDSRARSTAAVVTQVGEQLAQTIERTNHEICTLFTAFLAERSESPQLGHGCASVRTDDRSLGNAAHRRRCADQTGKGEGLSRCDVA
jgi:TetR/AcrR family transcriptional regulator, lmrAB and yxaGH operons repressor